MPNKPQSIPEQQLVVLKAILDETEEIHELLHDYLSRLLRESREQTEELQKQTPILLAIADALTTPAIPFPTAITFQETTMNPTQAGQTQVFTGTLVPDGSAYPADTTFNVTSNDTLVVPTVDATGLIVSVTYPDGWVESSTLPLAFVYDAASVSANASINATITPSAPPVPFPTGINFVQTQ